mgnify:FL=1
MHKHLQLSHAGVGSSETTAASRTTRINFWFDSPRTVTYTNFLEQQCDRQRIQGVMGVIGVDDADHYKIQLIVSNDVDVPRAAELWLEGVNKVLADAPQGLIRHLMTDIDAMAHPSE